MIAEVSKTSNGIGIELEQADIYEVPIICIYRTGSKVSGSLNVIPKKFIEYSNSKELISGIERIINRIQEQNLTESSTFFLTEKTYHNRKYYLFSTSTIADLLKLL